MLIKSWKKEKFLLLIMFFTAISVIFLFTYLAKDFCLFCDDYYYSMYNISGGGYWELLDCLSFNYGHGGGYIGYSLSKFISFALPNLLKIHPCDFRLINGLIRGIFTVICLLLICRFLNFSYKNKIIFCLGFIFSSIWFFYHVFYNVNLIIGVNYNYFRYFFSLVFFSIFWYYIFKHLLINYTKTNWLKLVGISACGYIIGTSSEILFIASILLSIMILIYGLISKKLYLNKNFYIPVVFLFIATFFFVTSKGFYEISLMRGVYSERITFQLIKEFTTVFINMYFKNFMVYWISFIIILGFSIFFAKKKKEIQKIILPIFMELSILLSIISLIKCGKTLYNSGDFWISHYHIIFLYAILIIYPLFFLISYVLRNIKIRKYIVLRSFYIILIISNLFLLAGTYTIYLTKGNIPKINSYKNLKNYYILEKIFRFYKLQDRIPIIPLSLDHRWVYLQPEQYAEKCDKNKFTFFIYSYYPNIYKDNDITKIYCVDNDAVKKFKEAGGSLSYEELKDLKFGRLFDEDFVLNKQSNEQIEKQ